MNREIKFRAWDKNEQKIREGDCNDYVELYKLKCPVCGTRQYQNSLIINSKIKDK